MGVFHRYKRGGKRLAKKPRTHGSSGTRIAALFLCLSMLTGFFPALARAEDGAASREMFSQIAAFDSITLHYTDADGKPLEPVIETGKDGKTLLDRDKGLALKYTYTITETQCANITAGTSYYLEVSPHLVLPDLKSGSSLTMTVENDDGTEEEKTFGMIYANGTSAWVTFDAGQNGNGTVLSDYNGIEKAYFYLDCSRADTVPASEKPLDGHNNLYAMKVEAGEILRFGYAEDEPVTAEAIIKKGGEYESANKTITWTIRYTPWQNPAPGGPVALDTPFELRDTIDATLHKYVDNSVAIKMGDTPVAVTYHTSGDTINRDVDAYVLAETPADGGDTTLTFGGTKFKAGEATGRNPAKSLTITYQTEINDGLLLPGATGGKKVENAAELFAAGEDGTFNSLNIRSSNAVTIPQPTWLEKKGKTTRTPGSGSTTDWTVTFQPNGFVFTADNSLTLHDQLPAGSQPVADSLYVNGTKMHVDVGDDNSFTVSSIVPDGMAPVTITYQTHVPEEMYDNGTPLGSNIAYFTFNYGGASYKTPEAETPIGSGDGSGQPGTSTLVKENKGYDAATRTIEWEVAINHHQAYLQSGTFTDNLGAVGPQPCGVSGHGHGLELVGGADGVTVKIDGKDPTEDEKALIDLAYSQQELTVTVKKEGANVIGMKAITLTYTTKVCDPCIFANNTAKTAFKNTISTTDMVIGILSTTGRSASADSTADVSAAVLTKKAPVYDYAAGLMTWTVEVDAAGLSMADVVLTDELPEGLSYVTDSLKINSANASGKAKAVGQTLTIDLGAVTGKTTVTFNTRVDPEILGFASGKTVIAVDNTILMDGSADGVEFATVSHRVQQNFSNHGLVKGSAVDNEQELIRYEVLINPYHLALPGNPVLVDTLDKRLQLDPDTLRFYPADVKGTSETNGKKGPSYDKVGDGQKIEIADFDPETNSFTVRLPVSAGGRGAYVLTYTADIIRRETAGYGNSVRFEGGSVLLGGGKDNTAKVSGGGGGGGGGIAARKATVAVVKTDSDTKAPIPGVTFTLYRWDSAADPRGLPFAQGTTNGRGELSFRVTPGASYELVESGSAPGYGSAFGWSALPAGVTETASGSLRITAGAQGSTLTLNLTNEAHTADIVFRLFSQSGIPMAGTEVHLFKTDPAGGQEPDMKITVAADGTVKFSGVRRGAAYYVRPAGGDIMRITVPADPGEASKITLPDNTEHTFTADYQAAGTVPEDRQWTLTVKKVVKGSGTPLPGASIGLYAEESCRTLLKKADSGPDGTVTFDGLMRDQTYWVKEITAPGGYLLNSAVYEGSEGSPDITIENALNPSGGGSGGSGGGNGGGSGGSGRPDGPDDPGTPGESGGTPGTPGDPGSPGDSGNLSDPDDPGDPGGSETPGTPDDPGGSETPGTPDDPGGSGDPGSPGNSDNLAASVGGDRGSGDSAVPQTGDNTLWLAAVFLASGALLAGMAAYRVARLKKREKK